MFRRLRLANFKVPKQIHFVSVMPRNAMGKVKRNDLTALFS
jgi:malonyl-CoA/methylmalonyl-CoA synthetase